MPRKSWLDLKWPVAGVDRSVSYQGQPPFTTPDAVNVRTEGAEAYRERGGSRPGVDLALRTMLPGPIRMLGKVSVLKFERDRDVLPTDGTQLRDYLVPQVGSVTYIPGAAGTEFRSAITSTNVILAHPTNNSNTTGIYELSVHARPAEGTQMTGSVAIHFGLANVSQDHTTDGRTAKITFTNGQFVVSLTEVNAGVPVLTLTTGTISTEPNLGGTFTVRVTPGTKQVQVYWRNTKYLDDTVTLLDGVAFKSELISADTSVLITRFTEDFQKLSMSYVPKNPRRDLLVASAEGELWVEDTVDTLVQKGTGMRDDVELVSVDREQKLYIADYGAVFSGSDGTISQGDLEFNKLTVTETPTGVDSSFAVQIIDSDYFQNQQQTVTVVATGGNFKLGFKGEYTPNQPYNETAVNLSNDLEALSTIGGSANVAVTGPAGGPYVVEFKGVFQGQTQPLLDAVNVDLTHGVEASVTTVETQGALDGAAIAGSYPIISVLGNDIFFDPGVPVYEGFVGTITNVEYQLSRTPKVYDAKADTFGSHLADAGKGVVPAGCRLVALYRDRIVYAGSDVAPHVWYMSRQGDPNDWDYTQEDSGAAIFAQASVAGQLAEPVTALIAHGDECLIFGGYNSLWIMRGDPGYGGSLDQLSRKVGIVGPTAWARTPDDMCVFLSADGLYVMQAGCAGFPTSLSRERLPDELLCLDPEKEAVVLEYDSLQRGVHIMVTRYDSSEPSHWFFDWEAKSFWRVKLQTSHEPFSMHERTVWNGCPIVLLGGRDGYIRYFNRDAEVDDGDNEIESYCYFGPFHLDRGGFREGLLTELQGTVGDGSGPVTWSVHVGNGSEQAFLAAARETGDWTRSGLNHNSRPRARGTSCCIKLAGKTGSKRRWFMERMTAVVRSAGRRRVR